MADPETPTPLAVTPVPGVLVPTPGPSTMAEPITPGTPLTRITRGVWVGGAGDVQVVMAGQSSPANVIFHAVNAGTLLPICITQVVAASTTATNLVAMY